MEDLLKYVQEHMDSMEKGGCSSNQIHFFSYKGRRCVVKTPLMVGDNISPFWKMLKNIFGFTFEKQNLLLPVLYKTLCHNPHIPFAPLLAVDRKSMVYGFMEGDPRDEDEFPSGQDNAYCLGLFIGYTHNTKHSACGLCGDETIYNFYKAANASMAKHIEEYWNGDDEVCKKVREFYNKLCKVPLSSARYVLMMADQSADQYLYDKTNRIAACVDLDAYVVAPAEWELTFLHKQVADWDAFRRGYEHYQALPDFDLQSDYFTFLMNLNAPWDKEEMAAFLAGK